MFLGLSVCLCCRLLEKLATDFDENFWMGGAWPKDQVVRFWWQSDRDPDAGIFEGYMQQIVSSQFYLLGGSTSLSRRLCCPSASRLSIKH